MSYLDLKPPVASAPIRFDRQRISWCPSEFQKTFISSRLLPENPPPAGRLTGRPPWQPPGLRDREM